MSRERVSELPHVPVSADGLPVYLQSLADFLAEEDPPVSVIFPELLPCGVVMLVHGEPRARKSHCLRRPVY